MYSLCLYFSSVHVIQRGLRDHIRSPVTADGFGLALIWVADDLSVVETGALP